MNSRKQCSLMWVCIYRQHLHEKATQVCMIIRAKSELFSSEIRLPTFTEPQRKQGNSRKNIYLCFDYTKAFDCVDHNKLWKTLKEIGIPDYFTYLLRNLYVSQEATVRALYETADWFRTEKGVEQGFLLSPCLFKLYAEHIMKIACWMSYKLESR